MSDPKTVETDQNGVVTNGPSQVTGQLKSAQGVIYSAIGSVIPESAGSSAWLESGAELQKEGQAKVDEAKRKQAVEATVDSAAGKLKTAAGYLTGDQQKQTEGNLEAQKAQASYKQATSDSVLSVPIPSVEGVKGQLQSVKGIVTGDQEAQREGNMRAEKAAWKDGV